MEAPEPVRGILTSGVAPGGWAGRGRRKLRGFFPELQTIDGVSMSSSLPVQVQGNHIPEEVDGIVRAFIGKFYGWFDGDRASLQHGYTADSVWSLTIESLGSSSKVPANYTALNRNLKKKDVRESEKTVTKLHTGAAIGAAINSFPETNHDMNLTVDVWMITPAFIGINVSGACVEKTPNQAASAKKPVKTTTRNVHRVFMLTPAAEGSPASLAGVSLPPLHHTCACFNPFIPCLPMIFDAYLLLRSGPRPSRMSSCT